MKIQIVTDNGFKIIELEGEVKLDMLSDLRASFQTVMENTGKCVIIDFKKTLYVDSSGIAALIEFRKKLDASGTKLFLVSLPPVIKKTFQVTNVETLFKIASSRAEVMIAEAG